MPKLLQQPLLVALTLLACLAGSFAPATARATTDIPPYRAFVTDQTNTLTGEQRAALESRLRQLQQQGIAELAILLVPTTAEETIFQYSMRVAEKWEVGSRHKDNGILLVIAMQDRTSQILVGYGLEGSLTDVASSRILRDVVPPRFRQNDFAGGLNAAIDAILETLQNPATSSDLATSPADARARQYSNTLPVKLPNWFVAGSILSLLFARLFLRPLLGKMLAGTGIAGVMLAGGLLAGLPMQLLLFVMLFAFLFVTGDNNGRGYRGGRSRGGFGGGGGGFGGGGGGRFGGGGASGRW